MKRITAIIALFASLGITSSATAQKIWASLGPGSTSNSVKIYLKSATAISVTNISTLQFNIGIVSNITPVPNATIVSSSISGVTWSIEKALEGGYNNYMIQTANSPLSFAMITNTDFEVLEVSFSGGPLNPQNVSLVTLPGGGVGAADGKALYYCSGIQWSAGNDLYYLRSGVTVVNNFSYNETTGATGTGTSLATLGNVILPTKFLSFLAVKKDDNAMLTWTVDNEEGNAYFDIQRSTDGRNFTDVLRVNAMHNGRSSNTYTTPDANISRLGSRTLYYRVRQVENTGTVIYSEVRQLNLDNKNFDIGIYPNPVANSSKLVIDAPEAGKAVITIRDISGKTVRQLSMDFVKGINQKNLDASMLAAGEYNVTVVSDKINQTVKMTKEK